MPSVIHNIRSFFRNSSAYLREAKTAEIGHTQAIRARYARKFLEEIGMKSTGPTVEEIEAELANMEKREGLPSSRPARAKKPRKERATK